MQNLDDENLCTHCGAANVLEVAHDGEGRKIILKRHPHPAQFPIELRIVDEMNDSIAMVFEVTEFDEVVVELRNKFDELLGRKD